MQERHVSEGDRVAALIAVCAAGGVVDIARRIRTDPSRLVQARNNRMPLSPSARAGFQRELRVREKWLRQGELPVFASPRRPGDADVERAILVQLAHGDPRTKAVPLFGSAAEAVMERPEAGNWREYASRAVMPSDVDVGDGFYVALDGEDAKQAGCKPVAYVFFVPADRFFKKNPPQCGMRFIALLRNRGEQLVRMVGIVDPDVEEETPPRKKRGGGDMKVMQLIGPQVMHRAVVYPRRPREGQLQVMAVGIRAERDTVELAPRT